MTTKDAKEVTSEGEVKTVGDESRVAKRKGGVEDEDKRLGLRRGVNGQTEEGRSKECRRARQ